MRFKKVGIKIFSAFLVLTIAFQSLFIFAVPKTHAQVGGGAQFGGNLNAGGSVSGVGATIIQCTGLADKIASLLGSLFSVKEVPVGDDALRKKEACLDAIARMIVVKIMDKITLATVDWINSGFEGQPLYLTDPEGFFTDIAEKEINSFMAWYPQDLENYPFGQIVMTAVLTNLQRQSQENLRYSLNQVLAHGNSDEFQVDFNIGGWAGYTALIKPNNNPVGNYLLVNQEIGRRISGTHITASANFSQQLQQSGGFLSQRECVLTATGNANDQYIPEDNPLHMGSFYSVLAPGSFLGDVTLSTLPTAVQTELSSITDLALQAEVYNDFVLRSRCKQWKTLTPGKVVSDQLTKALNIPTDQLLLADELNEDLALIFDALINQLVTTGLNSLQPASSGGTTLNNVLLSQVAGQQPGQVSNGSVPPPAIDQITGTGFSTEDLVFVQQEYIQLAQQSMPILDRLIQKINALDYCVPGPNPNWQTIGQQNLQNALLSTAPFVSGNPDPQDAAEENENYYAQAIENITGINITPTQAVSNYDQFTAFVNNVFTRYSQKMLSEYNPLLAPPSTRIFLENLLEERAIFQDSYDFLNTYLSEITSYLPTLVSIQTTINNIAAANGGVVDPSDPQVQAQISLYDSISSHFVTESELQTLQTNFVFFQNRETTVDGHLNSCIAETVVNANYEPDQRVAYPLPVYAYTQTVAPFAGLPNPDTSFLPATEFTDNTNNDDIDVSIPNVDINGSSDLSIFEAILQSVY